MLGLAFDKSARTYDADGRLHVRCRVAKAMVSPYRGAEIPDFEKLGLNGDKIYHLLRDPAELEAGVASFNGVPLLDQHIPVSTDKPMKDNVAGALGSAASWEAPYIWNDVTVWTAEALAGIESEDVRELSPAYRYVADMTPGEYQGLTFDGVMRNIIANHVALVESGRQGPDVVIGDSAMPILLKSRKAIAVKSALQVALKPMLAQDAKIDLLPLVKNITAANYKAGKPALVAAITRATDGKLAQDADMADIVELVDALGDVQEDGPDLIPDAPAEVDAPPAVDDDGDVMSKVMAFLQGKLSDEDMAGLTQLCVPGAADEPPPFEGQPETGASEGPNMISKPAMDAAIKKASDKAATDAVARINGVREAEKAVAPYVGEVVAMDSAAEVYKFALDSLKVDVTGVHSSAYAAILAAQPKPADATKVIALDASLRSETTKQFAVVDRIRRA
jgi:hypothetical protein